MKIDSRHIQDRNGEMSSLVNKKDWSQTSLGAREKWPRSLETLVELLLEHPFPSILLWGPDLIQIYNDGYRIIAAQKHPKALGQPARECWPEVLHINEPIFKQVLEKGRSVVLEDQLFPIHRRDYEEDAYFTLSYSPARNDEGEVAGVFLTIFETTERQEAEQKLWESKSRLDAFVTATSEVVYRMSPDWSEMYYLDGREFIVDTDEPRKTWLEEYIPEEEHPRVMKVINEAIKTNSKFDLEHQVVQVDGTLGWTHSRAIPILNEEGEVTEWFGAASDITDRKRREKTEQFLLRLSDQIRDLRSPEKIGNICARLLAEEINLDRVYFVQFFPDKEKAFVGPEYHKSSLEPVSGVYPFSAFPKAVQRIQREKLVFNDVANDETLPKEENKALLELGFGAWIGVPIRIERDKTDWALYAVFSEPHNWTEAEIYLIEETAERAWTAGKRAQAEQDLRESEERLQMAQDTAQLGYWELNIDTKTFSGSPICKAHFGRGPEDPLTFDDVIQAIHPDDWEAKKKIMQNALEKGESYDVEYRINWPDGTRRWIYTRAQTLGKSELSGVTLDITERKEIEEQLEQQARALQTSRMKLRSLVNELSHAEENQRYLLAGELHDNLGQILEVSKMKFDVLVKYNATDIPTEVYEIRDLITEAISCTRRLVNDLKPTPTEEKEDLDSALKWVAGKMEKHGLIVNIENGEKYKAVAQRSLNTLVQTVQELLFNVVKHAETDQAWLTVNRLNRYVQIKVKDEGKGFNPKQVEESTGHDGFGLFNVRQRIDLLGGTVNVESEPGKGTTALIQIPLKNVDTLDETPESLQSTENRESLTSSTAVISVLVVDDHQMMREGIAGIINAENDMVVAEEASTGEEAIRLVKKVQPDVVIMDVNLPGINGIEATKQIKVVYPETKVICISFLNDQELLDNIFSAGASDFIGKDETLQSICQAIREAVS